MKIVGVIAEFNPFHKGHAYLLNKIRQTRGADAIIVVMSGDFVQRGEPAILPSYKRIRTALENGADLILSLPVRWSLASAEGFAFGAVATLLSTGIVDEIICGTEGELDINLLQKISNCLLSEPQEYKKKLKSALKAGQSFPKARLAALSQHFDYSSLSFLESANNILATEYLKAICYFQSNCKLITIPREPGISAHDKRNQLLKQQEEIIVPDDFSGMLHYSYWLHTHILKYPPYEIDMEFNKELFQRFCKHIKPEASFHEVLEALKTKQYTRTRISRLLLRYLLCLPCNNTRLTLKEYAPYLRVLGFRKNNAKLLSLIENNQKAPVIKKLIREEATLSEPGLKMLNQELAAEALYQTIANAKYPHWHLKNAYETGMVIVNDTDLHI